MFGLVGAAVSGLFSPSNNSNSTPIEAIGKTIGELFTSDDERLTHQEILTKLAQAPQTAQQEINKLEAQSRSTFVSGWRPAIGWVCAVALLFNFVLNPLIQWIVGSTGPVIDQDMIMKLVWALLGLGGFRTVEKIKGRTK